MNWEWHIYINIIILKLKITEMANDHDQLYAEGTRGDIYIRAKWRQMEPAPDLVLPQSQRLS